MAYDKGLSGVEGLRKSLLAQLCLDTRTMQLSGEGQNRCVMDAVGNESLL